jgi:coniferyl-aldehyde dehydrogenase
LEGTRIVNEVNSMTAKAGLDTAGLSGLLDAQRAAFLRAGPPSVAQRRDDLEQLRRGIVAHRDDLAAAIDADFGHRSREETTALELAPLIEGVRYLHRNVARFMRPERRSVAPQFLPASARVVYQPLGVVGIISPWNYPVGLALMPLATALAAGNRAMIKPSELTPTTAEAMVKLLREIFPAEKVAVVTGDVEVGKAFAALGFDHLVFTGSTNVGRSIMRMASDNLVPVVLELGGKSPVIVEAGAPLDRAARRIAFGKLGNAGQTCIAPDYALVPEAAIEAFVTAFGQEVAKLYPGIATNPDYTTIVNDHHHSRLRGLLEDARAKGARIVDLGELAAGSTPTHPRTMIPALVLDVTDDMGLMKEEIFGPILPVVAYRSLEDAVTYVNARPRPLALYYFGPDGPGRRLVLERTTSGGVTIDDTLLHFGQEDLPFGGVGASGIGAYHGPEGFRTMSHARAIFTQARWNGTDLIRPPFGKVFEYVANYFLR